LTPVLDPLAAFHCFHDLVIPCRAMPCHAMLCYAMPCRPTPRQHAVPCRTMPACGAMPCGAMPSHATPACRAVPCNTMPRTHAMSCHAMRCHAVPCVVMPCAAMPCVPTTTRHAVPCVSCAARRGCGLTYPAAAPERAPPRSLTGRSAVCVRGLGCLRRARGRLCLCCSRRAGFRCQSHRGPRCGARHARRAGPQGRVVRRLSCSWPCCRADVAPLCCKPAHARGVDAECAPPAPRGGPALSAAQPKLNSGIELLVLETATIETYRDL